MPIENHLGPHRGFGEKVPVQVGFLSFMQSDECPNHSLCGAHRLRVSPTCCRCRRPEPQRGCGGASEGRCECPHGDNTRRDPLNAL